MPHHKGRKRFHLGMSYSRFLIGVSVRPFYPLWNILSQSNILGFDHFDWLFYDSIIHSFILGCILETRSDSQVSHLEITIKSLHKFTTFVILE